MKGASNEVNPETEEKLITVTQEYEEKKLKYQIVKTQLTSVEDDMRRLTLSFNLATAEYEKLNNKLEEKQLQCEGGKKLLQQKIVNHQERMVDESLLKMRVYHMDMMVQKQKDKVYNLKKHKADLALAVNERIVSINVQTKLLMTKRKHLLEELIQLRADIGDRNLKIQSLMARYRNTVDLLGKNEDGTIISATQIKIETAQEKQVLLQAGNELNEKVMNAEKDIKAIENTLVLLNYSNDTYKKTLEPINDNSNCF